MITTVIFDLDGLLADTERLHCEAYQTVLGEIGVKLTPEEYAQHWIRKGRSIADFLQERGLDYDPWDLRERKTQVYAQLLERFLLPMPGAPALLQRLQGRKRLALASSARADSVACVLHKLDFEDYFELVAAEGCVPRLKPHPDLFLYAAKQLGVKPVECVVLEDAEKGILAAHAAGMKSLAIPNELTRDNDFAEATRVLNSLEEVTLDLIESL